MKGNISKTDEATVAANLAAYDANAAAQAANQAAERAEAAVPDLQEELDEKITRVPREAGTAAYIEKGKESGGGTGQWVINSGVADGTIVSRKGKNILVPTNETEYTNDSAVAKAYVDGKTEGKADKQNESGGFAGGEGAIALGGGAIGAGAQAGDGFAGGKNAITTQISFDAQGNRTDTYVDAIQLGTGQNLEEHTFQVYWYRMMDAEGNIPKARIETAIADKADKTEITRLDGEITTINNRLETELGDMEAALDSIIAIQNELIGGEAE